MAKFTTAEANACIIAKCSKHELSGVHQYYTFGVTDDNDFYYEWTDADLEANASHGQIKVAIRNYLTVEEDKLSPPPVIVETDDDAIIGDTVNPV
jgi:hypothetical protein